MQQYSSTSPAPLGNSTETSPNKRIYLAGKISKNDWRTDIVKGLRSAIQGGCPPNTHDQEWPILRRSIFKQFDYVGPYFVGCDHGCFHASHSHGYGDVATTLGYDSHDAGAEPREELVQRCLAAIDSADLVFAWLDSLTAYGTLIELGYAVAKEKPIAVAIPRGNTEDGALWFAHHLPSVTTYYVDPDAASVGFYHASSVRAVLRLCLLDLEWVFESPLEIAFWRAWQRYFEELPLEPQYEVFNGRYRLDFAHVSTKTAIEVDGFTYHNDRRAFERDRKRDRELAEAGWKTIRFASQELMADPRECAEQAARMIRANGGE